MWNAWWFEDRKTKEVKGGIKAQTKRGDFGKNWWAKRWIEVLESFNIGTRLGRGRTYARKGQVISIDIKKGVVKSKVQGSMPRPYNITIKLAPLSKLEWDQVIEALSAQALFTAKLLSGEMPQDIEIAFQSAGVALFPEKNRDLETDCSCPDWSNPCKHIAAVYYLLGEEFDRDPFLLFKLRGMEREALLDQLQEAAGEPEAVSEPPPPEPLPVDPASFWKGEELPDDLFENVETPATTAAWPRRLGNFPFWRGKEQFLTTLEPLYKQASQNGMKVFLGEVSEKGTG